MCSPNFCFFVKTKSKARNIIFNQRPIVINKINNKSSKNCKNIQNNTVYTVQELRLYLFSFSARVILASFTSSIVSVHSSTNLSTNFFLHLQFS